MCDIQSIRLLKAPTPWQNGSFQCQMSFSGKHSATVRRRLFLLEGICGGFRVVGGGGGGSGGGGGGGG